MIWKTILVVSVAHYVLSEQEKGAVSEQRVTIHHSKSHITEHSNGDKESENHEEYAWANPSYEFSYKVNDPHTHDVKGQNENRHGDEVKGIYWLLEPNGDTRTVNYNANDHKGFNAQVDYARYEKHNENSDDNNGYSVHEEQSEDIVQNKNEENNNETSNKEEIEEGNKEENTENNKEENTENNKEENAENNKEENDQGINESAEKNQEENMSEKNNDNVKENENIAEEEGENVEVVRRPTTFNLKDDDERLEHIKQHDIKRNIYKNDKEGNGKTEKYGTRNERTRKINLNNHDYQIDNNRGFSKQEKKSHQSKNIEGNNGGHKTARRNENTAQINENEKRFGDQNSENKSKNNQKKNSKSKSDNEADTYKLYIGKLDDIDDNESQTYQHRIFINHPKFSISSPKQKRHRH